MVPGVELNPQMDMAKSTVRGLGDLGVEILMSPVPTPASDTQATLNDAYLTLEASKEGPGKVEKAFDAVGNAIASTSESPTLSFANEFYNANRAVITTAAAGFASLDNKTIDSAISGFTESVKVVMKGLDGLSQVHPFIGVAVVAFKLVVTLDMTRRENNQKVMAVKIQMQQMMCTLFQLREVKDPDTAGPDGIVLKDRMQPLMEQIARDIKECGSACDVYSKKSFIAKTLKSKIYQGRLASYAAKFTDYRDQLDKALTVHIALGVDAANRKLDTQSSDLQSIKGKLDLLFQKLETAREREVHDFIEKSGGAEMVVERDDLIQVLVAKSGETMDDLADESPSNESHIDFVKEKLQKELSEDVDAALERNFTLFDRKLKVQERNTREALEKQGQYMEYMVSFLSGGHDRIKDTELQNLWKEMGWKGSVKARHLVLALRDYFTDKFTSNTLAPRASEASPVELTTPEPTSNTTNGSAIQTLPSRPTLDDDRWALQYLTVANLQSILEAIDDDGTGFVSINEANAFAVERPKGWSLLRWVAFWAKGWETSLADYKNKIILILREMDQLRDKVLQENRGCTDSYLRQRAIIVIEFILRSTRANQESSPVCQELVSLTEAYVGMEEEKLRQNLEGIEYDIDSAETVTLVTGPRRIGRYLFPLLYLTLKRHLEVFRYACKRIVNSEEFPNMSTSLRSILDVVEERVQTLKAVAKQTHVDLHVHLETFSLGMYHDFALSARKYGPRESLITTWQDTSKSKKEFDGPESSGHPASGSPIFSDPDSQPDYGIVWRNWPPHSFDTNPFRGTIDGYWTGRVYTQGKRVKSRHGFGLIQLKIEIDPEDRRLLKGFAVMGTGNRSVYGRRRWVKGEDGESDEFDMVVPSDGGKSVRFVGRRVERDEELVGEWKGFSQKEDARKAYDAYPFSINPPTNGQEAASSAAKSSSHKKKIKAFIFRRTPVEVCGFRHILDEDESKAKARWKFLREAVLHVIRQHLWSQRYFRAWSADRRAFLDYYRRHWLRRRGFTIHNPLTREEKDNWRVLEHRLPPAMICLCVESLVWSLRRLPFHYNVTCDGCGGSLIEPRFICLTCMDPEMSNSFDLCSQCINKPAERDTFSHTVGHTLIKSRQYIPGYLFPGIINRARQMTVNLKKIFTEMLSEEDQDMDEIDGRRSAADDSELLCGSCARPVDIPCWACITCAPETYICNDCEEKELPVLKDGPGCTTHSPSHPLLRLHNLEPARFEREKVDLTVARVNALESAVDQRFGTLESRITSLENRTVGLEARIADLGTNIEAHLTSKLESLLRRIAVQLNVPDHDELSQGSKTVAHEHYQSQSAVQVD